MTEEALPAEEVRRADEVSPAPTDDEPPVEASPATAAARPARGRQSIGDMVRSMALVVGVVLIGVFATVSLGRDPVLDIDYSSDLIAARTGAPYEILAPVGLEGYRATSVRFLEQDGATVWHLGLVAPSEEYVGIDQTDGRPAGFIDVLTEGAKVVAPPVTIAAEEWTRYDGGGDDDDESIRGLVRIDGAVTVLVSGTAGWDELEQLAGALDAG